MDILLNKKRRFTAAGFSLLCCVIISTIAANKIPGYGQISPTPFYPPFQKGGIVSYFPSNYRIYPSQMTQTETIITRHPQNPSIIFASANTLNLANGFKSEGIYVTTDGGLSWYGSDTCKGAPITAHAGDPGPVVDKDGRFIMTRLGNFPTGIFSHYSTDAGITWSSQQAIATGDFYDVQSSSTDGSSTSSYFGRTYTTWVRLSSPYPVFFTYTTNGGVSWNSPIQINNPSSRCQGTTVKTDANGKICVSWAGVTNVSPFTEDFVGFASSTNGGINWNVTENAYDMNGIAGQLPSGIRVNGLPRMDIDRSGGVRNGWIYIVTGEKNLPPAGSDPDIIFHRSSNGGQTWSAGVRVNQDPLNNGKTQYFGAIRVDENGGINIIYYDNRNTTSDSSDVFLSRSTDGGNTWNDYEITDHHFKPVPIGGFGSGYAGDLIGITSGNNKLFPVWADNSTGLYQIWTVTIDINTIGIRQIGSEVPKEFKLEQNYPNPFNASSKFKIQISRISKASVIIYDLLGREIATLVNQELKPGTYEVEWDGTNYPSGVYFYQLIVPGFTETKKMALVK